MKLGADDPKKVIVLGALVVIGGYLLFSEVLSGPSSTPAASATLPAIRQAAAPVEVPQPARPAARTSSRSRVQSDEFHPVLHPKRPEDRIDTAKVDPTLRLDLLAKVQNTDSAGPGRNVFQFGQAPLPPEPKVPLKPPPAAAVISTSPPPTAPPGPPPPPPITLRYYGFSSIPGSTAKTAFFLDGEDILVAKEGETVKRRYRVVRIGATSVVMEDTESKRQQTIPLAEEAAG
jgi:hypothetical protein